VNIGLCPPATTIASNRSTSSSKIGLVFSTKAASLGMDLNPIVMRSVEE
jgi:hypothetical protein